MASQPQSNPMTIEDALTEAKLVETAQRLSVLPTADEFKKFAEDELWDVLVSGSQRDGDTVNLSELPRESRNVIGYLDEEESVLPWWFDQFDWQFSYEGDVVLDTSDDPLSDLEDLTRGSPDVSVPSFREDNQIYAALEGFEMIDDYLKEQLDFGNEETGNESSRLGIPRRAINESTGDQSEGILRYSSAADWIESTDSLDEWVRALVDLVPPNSTTMTALMLVNCGLKKKFITGVSEVTEVLSQTLGDSSWNSQRHRANAFAKILRWEQVLDLRLERSEYDEITAFEESLYRHWSDIASERDEAIELSKRAKDRDSGFTKDREYAQYLLGFPVKKFGSSDYVTFASVRTSGTYGSPVSDDEKRSETIYRLLTGGSSSDDA